MNDNQNALRRASAHQASADALYDLTDPPGIRRSKQLSNAEKALYRWVWQRAEFRFDHFVSAPFDLVAADTGFAESGIRDASKFLRDRGLMERDIKPGRNGYTHLKVFDCEPFASAEGTLQLVTGASEPTLPLDFGDDGPGLAIVGEPGPIGGDEDKSAVCPGVNCAFDAEQAGGRDSANGLNGMADCATADENPLSALVSALKSGLGADRYETWLEPCRLLIGQAGSLQILAQNKFAADQLRRMLLGQIKELLVAAGHGIGASIDVDPEPPPLKVQFAKAQSAPGQTALLRQGSKRDLPYFGNPPGFQSKEEEEGRKEHLLRMEQEEDYRLMYRAVELYWRIGEFEVLFPWITIGAVLAIDEGVVTADEINAIAVENACEFGKIIIGSRDKATKRLVPGLLQQRKSNLWKPFVIRHAAWRRGVRWQHSFKHGIHATPEPKGGHS